ncbi:DMT family transporter [Deinococcus oregonensis]|uniref:DMT family transporter n=1 Tax=Deinococcus oregonensis TaxID=1805970 RepID=A0ABV6B4W9_9DEIO
MTTAWTFLLLAILFEVIGSVGLKASKGFTVLGPSFFVVVGYAAAFFLLSLALRTLPLSAAYAVWAGLGTVLVAIVGLLLFKDPLTWVGVFGIVLIIAGVLLLNLFGRGHA